MSDDTKFQKGAEGNRKGRPKGSPNKVTQSAREAIAAAAAGLGGHERLIQWVKADAKNEAAFWTVIYLKLLPLKLAGDAESPVALLVERIIVDPKND